jgi:hypothetical protein
VPKFRCNRCLEDLKTESGLANHQRAEQTCEIKPAEIEEGISVTQEQALKSRKKTGKTQSEEEKWTEMYKIVFPEHSIIPSPCK